MRDDHGNGKSDYNEDHEIVVRDFEAVVERENALFERHGVPLGQPLIGIQGDPEVQTLIRERNEIDARMSALYEYYNRPGVDPHTIARPEDPDDCTWLK